MAKGYYLLIVEPDGSKERQLFVFECEPQEIIKHKDLKWFFKKHFPTTKCRFDLRTISPGDWKRIQIQADKVEKIPWDKKKKQS